MIDLVHAVQELGAEVRRAAPPSRGLRAARRCRVVEDVLRADVAGHDDDGVLEIHGAALAVGDAAVVEHLQQDVEDVVVRLFDLVEQDDASTACGARLR